LARDGLAAFPPSAFPELGNWLRDFGVATGDARYYALSDLVHDLAHPFSGGRGVPVAVTASVDDEIRAGIPEVLDAEDSSFAASQAHNLHAKVTQIVREGPS
jgi:hypothetical protein